MTKRRMHRRILTGCAIVICGHAHAGDDWVTYTDATDTALVAAAAVGTDDIEEKDYAVADVDLDGDLDLIVVRKTPFTAPGGRRNVLFINGDGVLVDRTAQYAMASDVPGDLGFLTPTNDRDVVVADIDHDGWPDLITCTTMSDGLAKHIGHPRIYRNLGEADGAWLGFRHEDARIPQLFTNDGVPANPRFNAVAAGDVTGDGFIDLYFVDGDLGGGDPSLDLNDRVLTNDGTGHFIDGSKALPAPVLASSTAISCAIADMNGDGLLDLVKSTQVQSPVGVWIAYNGPSGFTDLDHVYQLAPTNFTVGDLNADGRLDLVVVDDGPDRAMINFGNDDDGRALFFLNWLPADSAGFGGNTVIRDLDHDGAADLLIADVNFDIPGCARSLLVYRNDGTTPNPEFTSAAPSSVPTEERSGVHDVAVFDLNDDGALDLILGRCSGTTVLLGTPPPPCLGDVNADGAVSFNDLLAVLGAWGPCGTCPEDLDGDGGVSFDDVLIVIAAWGDC